MTHPDVLQSDEPVVAGGIYTTWHETDWINRLAKDRKFGLLTQLRRTYERRHWDGPGMAVDGAAVMRHLDWVLLRRPR